MVWELRAFCLVCPCGVVRSAQHSNIFDACVLRLRDVLKESSALCLPCWLHKRYTSATNGTFRCNLAHSHLGYCVVFSLGIFSVASRLQWWGNTWQARLPVLGFTAWQYLYSPLVPAIFCLYGSWIRQSWRQWYVWGSLACLLFLPPIVTTTTIIDLFSPFWLGVVLPCCSISS